MPPLRRVLVLDLGDVVCRFTPERRMRALVELTGRPAPAIDDAVWGSGLDRRAESGEIAAGAIVDEVSAAVGVTLDAAPLRRAWSRAFTPDPAVLAVVDDLRAPPVLFTNNGPLLSLVLDHELAAVAGRFSACVCSWQVGRRKPAAEAFTRLARHLGRRPPELVLVDDGPANVDGARSVGIDAVRYTTPHGLRDALGARDLLR